MKLCCLSHLIFFSGNSLRKIFHTFSPEFLEPFSEGTCGKHTNCLACMLDTLCAWCDLDKTCVIRNVTKGESACVDQNSRKMLITDGSVCPVCSDHVECLTCAEVTCLSVGPDKEILFGYKYNYFLTH